MPEAPVLFLSQSILSRNELLLRELSGCKTETVPWPQYPLAGAIFLEAPWVRIATDSPSFQPAVGSN